MKKLVIRKLKKEHAIERYKRLSAQLNPHFLFNVLNSIQYQILENNTEKSIEMLNNFSNLVRRVLNNSMSLAVPLTEEIKFLELYMDLERKRMNESFNYTIDLDGIQETDEIYIPPMVLQPIIENSVIHGFKNKNNGKIEIKFYVDLNCLHCKISDNGEGLRIKLPAQNGKESLSLKINKERINVLNTLCNENSSSLSVKNREDVNGVEVKFCIPTKISKLLQGCKEKFDNTLNS